MVVAGLYGRRNTGSNATIRRESAVYSAPDAIIPPEPLPAGIIVSPSPRSTGYAFSVLLAVAVRPLASVMVITRWNVPRLIYWCKPLTSQRFVLLFQAIDPAEVW